jgi:asparagine synthase (glutamine-hydrolysing)
MCGLTGYVDFKNRSEPSMLSNMLETLDHRGPDDSGVEFFLNDNIQIALGHKRLSVLDLSKNGHQPYKFKNLVMVYNGEIYNFREIREELKSFGYSFLSDSDTEVVIKAFHYWGAKAFNKFNGMFSIVVYDTQDETLILARDRAGVKPLYYYYKDDLFMFSSEIKAFHQHNSFDNKISNKSIALYLQHGYVPQPFSIFTNVSKLENGHFLTLDIKTKEASVKQYWSVYDFYQKTKLNLSKSEALQKLDELINASVKYRMISDVPIGCFLSGGYDSSLVAAIMQKNSHKKIKTFCIGFDDANYDETQYARLISEYLGTEHTEYTCTSQDALDILPDLPDILDEPMSDTSIIPTLIVSRIAKKKVTVSLSGDGGDELFGGYDSYSRAIRLNSLIQNIPHRKAISKSLSQISKLAPNFSKFSRRLNRVSNILLSENSLQVRNALSNTFLPNDVKKLLVNKGCVDSANSEMNKLHIPTNNELDTLLATDFQYSQMDQLLVKVDRASMFHSLEVREPLLDYKIVEFAAQLREDMKLRDGVGKYLLKQLTHMYVPKKIMDRKKMGFSVPIDDWLKEVMSELIEYYLSDSKIRQQNIFELNELKKLKDSYLHGKNINPKQLWSILMFQMWYEKWV